MSRPGLVTPRGPAPALTDLGRRPAVVARQRVGRVRRRARVRRAWRAWLAGLGLGALALGGAGILSLGVGLVTGIVAISKKGELDTTCPVGTPVCSPDAQHTVGAARAFADVSTGTLVLGAVAVAAGATLLFTVGDGKRLFVSASAAPGSGGLAATGKF